MATKTLKVKISKTVRNAVSSVGSYWDKPGQAITQIAEVMGVVGGLRITDVISFNDAVADARFSFRIEALDGTPVANSTLYFSWHKMEQSGRYEITAYLS